MKPEMFSTRACARAPNCQLDMEGLELLNQIFVYGMVGVVGVVATVMFVVYTILAVHKMILKARRLLGVT